MDIANRIKLINIAKSHLDMIHGELEAARQMYEKMDRLLENAVEIGQIAALLEEKEKNEVEDGKELAMFCADLAKKFEEQFDPENGDYCLDIDEFASSALIEEYGISMKSSTAYVLDMHKVCYISNAGKRYTHSDLLALVQGDDVLCGIMFDNLNGEEPSEFINYNIKCQLWMKCEACGRIFTAYDNNVTECAHCHTLLPGDVHFDVAVDKELGYK